MRTTVDIEEDLLREARARAVQSGRTLGQVVGDALRVLFQRTADRNQGAHVALPTFAGGGLQPGVDLDDGVALLDLMERDV